MTKLTQGLVATISLIFNSFGADVLAVGQKAPLFRTESTQGIFDLAAVLKCKPVILAFYYADFTPV